jgi:hypothetical protein
MTYEEHIEKLKRERIREEDSVLRDIIQREINEFMEKSSAHRGRMAKLRKQKIHGRRV